VREIEITVVTDEGGSYQITCFVDEGDTDMVRRILQVCREFAQGGVFFSDAPEAFEPRDPGAA